MIDKDKKEPNSIYRIQLGLSTDALKRLEDVMGKVEATTKAEVIRRALRLYVWLVDNYSKPDQDLDLVIQQKDGSVICKIDTKNII